uniref:hypothetical protein n=1 Tax=Sphingomonas sp. TaxID=28214 RepID=UPI0025D628EB|nr:hypothetical protein [Sphingomonas sp.]
MKAALLLTLLSMSITVDAVAQVNTELETGSIIPIPRRATIDDRPGLSEVDRFRLAMSEFARCTVDRKSVRIAQLLRLPADKINGASMVPLADDQCLSSGEMKFNALLLRGALFVELYRRRSAAEARGQAWRLPATPFDSKASVSPSSNTDATHLGLLAFADCVVTRDPVTTRGLVKAPTTSKAQDAAFAVLSPNLGPCLLQGQKIKLGKMILEGALGEILYRGTVQSMPQASKETK